MLFKQSPYHYWYRYLNPDAKQSEPTPSMILGELIHTMVLEPLLINERYAIAPEINRRTKAGKEDWVAFQEESKGKVVVTAEMAGKAGGMAASCAQNELFDQLLDGALVERSIYFEHQDTGIPCKCRPDAWNGSIVVDLKTTVDANYRSFQSSAMKYGYFLQAGMAHEGLKSLGIKMKSFVFACVENSSPYATAVFTLDEEAINYGVGLFNGLMNKFYAGMTAVPDLSEPWPSYPVQSLTVPKWADYEDVL